MRVIHATIIEKEPVSDPENFVVGPVTRQLLITKEGQTNPNMNRHLIMAIANFSQGSRTMWHRHSSDQVLLVTAGKGVVATEHEQKDVYVGDIIFFPADEKNWHGASKDSSVSLMYVLPAGSTNDVLGA